MGNDYAVICKRRRDRLDGTEGKRKIISDFFSPDLVKRFSIIRFVRPIRPPSVDTFLYSVEREIFLIVVRHFIVVHLSGKREKKIRDDIRALN